MHSDNSASAQAQYKKLTQTPIKKLIISLSVPTVISMMITMIYNVADTYFVSKISVSASGVTGIEIAQPISNVVSAVVAVPFMLVFLKQLKNMQSKINE